jgi:hypothetical protein
METRPLCDKVSEMEPGTGLPLKHRGEYGNPRELRSVDLINLNLRDAAFSYPVTRGEDSLWAPVTAPLKARRATIGAIFVFMRSFEAASVPH